VWLKVRTKLSQSEIYALSHCPIRKKSRRRKMRQASYSRSSDGQKDGYACANPVKEAETLERRRMSSAKWLCGQLPTPGEHFCGFAAMSRERSDTRNADSFSRPSPSVRHVLLKASARLHPSWRRPRRRGLPFVRAAYHLGDAIVVRGQGYQLVAFEPHMRKDGSKTKLAVWSSCCAQCGEAFTCRSPMTCPPQRRRCDEHKAPRRWVRKPSAEPQDKRKAATLPEKPVREREAQ